MASWPATLPQTPLQEGYNEEFSNTALRTEMAVGPPMTRRRISNGVKPHQMSFYMTSTQLDTLGTFFNDTLYSGAESFTWDHPRTDVNETWLFNGAPSAVPQGVGYLVTVKLDQLP